MQLKDFLSFDYTNNMLRKLKPRKITESLSMRTVSNLQIKLEVEKHSF